MSSCSITIALRAAPFRAGRSQRRSVRAHAGVSADSGFKARWSLDVRFGSKADATALLQEWVRDVGSEAGLTPDNTSLTTGSIGAPESTLELEVRFASLAELEAFWSAIPQQQHRAWGQRMQQYIVHGSPQWSVYRCLPAFPVGSPTTAGAAAAGSSASLSGAMAPSSSAGAGSFTGLLQMPSEAEVGRYAADAPPTLPSTQQQTASGLSIVSGDEEAQVVLDWKGDPMKINPGDKMPFRFL